MPNKNTYKDDSIISLDPRQFTRLRPSTYLGSNEFSTQLVVECVANSLDEHNIGHGDEIDVDIDTANNIYKVIDHGQGFPINVQRPDGKTVLEASFSVLNTSGKYDDSGNGVYQCSLGTNGIGSKLITFLSLTTEVISYNNKGDYEHIRFKDGIFEKREIGNDLFHSSGTTVTWQPDPQFFQNPAANISDLKTLFESISALCPKLTIKFKVDDNEIIYHTENGILALVDNKVKDKEIINTRFVCHKELENQLVDICMTYTSDYSENIIAYMNYGLTESGVHISTMRAGLTRQINKYAVDNGLLKENQNQITQAELNEGLFIVFNIKAANVKYDSQTKKTPVDFDKVLLNSVINNEFVDWLNNNPKDAKTIIDKALLARKAKIAAQKAKDNIRGAQVKGKKFISLPTKLVDCWTKKRSDAELWICEGDSAAANFVAKRDCKTQAIFPVRGKVLSCRKASIDKIYANQEVSNIVKALGLEIDKTTGKIIYDSNKLRYGKIIFAADADIDGKNILSLLINMFWELCKDIVTNGHIYIALPPLFKITTLKNEYVFLRDEKALLEYKNKHKHDKYLVQRSKGIGEMDAEETKYCLLSEATRNVQQIIVNDEKYADDLLECFFGTDVGIRRKYLLDHQSEVGTELKIY